MLVGRSPIGILAVLGVETVGEELGRARMHDLGHGGALQAIEALPDLTQPLPAEMSHDHGGKVSLPGGQLLVGQHGQFSQVGRVHVL